MIRLATTGIDDFAIRQVAVRLRDIAIMESCNVCWPHVPEEVDAVAFLGLEPIDENLIAECLSKGMHVLLAAPSILSGEQLSALCAVAAIANVRFRVVNPDRYLPSRQLIHDQLIVGQLGAVGLIRSHRWESRAASTGTEHCLPQPLIRDLDLTSWLFGAVPEVIYAVESSHGRTCVQVHLGFVGGGMAIVDYSSGLPPDSGYQMLSVIGSAGVAYADDHRNMQLHFSGGRPRAISSDEQILALTNIVQAFVDDLIAGKDMSSSVADWQQTLQLAEAVRRSLNSHTSVSLKEV
jgi:predicted dehydrogenase